MGQYLSENKLHAINKFMLQVENFVRFVSLVPNNSFKVRSAQYHYQLNIFHTFVRFFHLWKIFNASFERFEDLQS